MFVLLHLQKDGKERRHIVKKLPAIVGRIKSVDVMIGDQSVSREHIRIFERDGKIHVADLNSSNGTFVNGKRVSLAPVEPGDEIRLGAAKLRLATVSEDAAPLDKAAHALDEKPAAPPLIEIEDVTLPDETSEPAPSDTATSDTATSDTATSDTTPEQDPKETVQRTHPVPSPPSKETRIFESDRAVPDRARGMQVHPADGGDIKVKQDILQFHRIDPKKGRTVFSDDFSQYGGTSKLLIVIILVAVAVGGFFFFRWLGESVTPDEAGVSTGVESVQDGNNENDGLEEDGL